MNGIMNLVLDFLEKLNGDFRLGIIVNTGRVDFKHLTVKHLFRNTDIADTLQQLLEVSTATQIFQALIIQSEALSHILLQNPRCPNTKLHAALRFHTVADRNDDIKIIVIHLISLTVSGSCCKICNNCFSLQFALSENVLDMSGNGRLVSLKQLCHLVNGQPNRIAVKGRFNFRQSIFCCIDDHLGRIVIFILSIHVIHSVKFMYLNAGTLFSPHIEFGHQLHDNYIMPFLCFQCFPLDVPNYLQFLCRQKNTAVPEGCPNPELSRIFLSDLQANRQGRSIHPYSSALY